MAGRLWASGDAAQWQRSLGAYGEALQARGKPDLPALDRWCSEELPAALAGRRPRHLTAAELVRLVEWKLQRNRPRPRLLAYAKAQTDAAVRAATTAAFVALSPPGTADAAAQRSAEAGAAQRGADAGAAQRSADASAAQRGAEAGAAGSGPEAAGASAGGTDCGSSSAGPPTLPAVEAALQALTVLKGVGSATASAVLALGCRSLPYMGDEALAAALGGPPGDYSAGAYLRLVAALRAKAAALSTAEHEWTPWALERALWAAEQGERQQKQGAKPAPARKRKR